MTRLHYARSGAGFPAGTTDFSFLKDIDTGSEDRPAFSTSARVSSGGKAAGGMKLATHHHL